MATGKIEKADEDRIVVNTLIDAAEPMLQKALRIYKQKPRTGEELRALRALEVLVTSIEVWRFKNNANG